jgi:hydroxyacylglutathione hydrolase
MKPLTNTSRRPARKRSRHRINHPLDHMSPCQVIPVPAFQDNYIWIIRNASHAAVVDPGDARPALDYLVREKLRLSAILNTHHHADHVGGNAALLAHRNVPVFAPHDERIAEATLRVGDGDHARLDEFGLDFEVLEIPGHTRSHIAFHGNGLLFCGDTLFACGCGRLFEGTPAQMFRSLSRLAALPDDTQVYCGHEYTLSNIRFAKAVEPDNQKLRALEPEMQQLRERGVPTLPSVIGREKHTNPFLRCREPAVIEAASRAAGVALTDPAQVLGAIREWKDHF